MRRVQSRLLDFYIPWAGAGDETVVFFSFFVFALFYPLPQFWDIYISS